MRFPRSIVMVFGLLVLLGVTETQAQQQEGSRRTLIVGTKEAPPFAMKAADDRWIGISIDLWREISRELNIEYEFRELDLQGLLDGAANGSLDVAVAALTITLEREKVMDFTHPFHTTGLGIAIAPKEGRPWLAVLRRFLSLAFLKVAAALALLLSVVGVVVWWFERKRNPQQFGGGTAYGIGSGFWWSAVTMTTVGYGDKAPVTLGGRVVALIWMFAAIIIISSFTAAITTALTVTQLISPVRGPEDLPKVRVGTVAGTTSEAYLRQGGIPFGTYGKPLDGLNAIADGQIDALVYDAPLLRYLVNQEFRGTLEVLPRTFYRQDYGIALPAGSPLREPLNRALLREIRDPAWQDTLKRYLGG